MSESTIFQSCRDKTSASWVLKVLEGVNAAACLRTKHDAANGDRT